MSRVRHSKTVWFQKLAFLISPKRPFIWVFACFFLASPNEAWAWGPTFHSYISQNILTQLALLTPAIAHLLRRYPNDFLYGSISADIILGKKFIDYYYHCHNWRVGMEVFSHAKTDAQKAFALGYLSHLAADVIAHNFFIPDKMVRAHQTRTPRHMYWELRYDLRYDPKLLKSAHRIAQHYHEQNDPLLEHVLEETLFSFKTNKKIFNSLLILQKQVRVQNFMHRVAKRSPHPLKPERAERYQELVLKGVIDVLNNLQNAEVFHADPAGHQKIDTAIDLRKKIKNLKSSNSVEDPEVERIVDHFHEILNDTLFCPQNCPDAEGVLTTFSG